jgi:hypothetical protein
MGKQLQKANTPMGEARWAFLDKPKPAFDGKGDGKFEITVVFKPTDAAWKTWATGITASVKQCNGKQNPIHWETEKKGDQKVKTGNLAVRFKTGSAFKPKVFDKYNRPLPEGTLVGNGSKVIVNYSPDHYEGFGGGITLYLNAVQIVDLVPYTAQPADAEAYGFAASVPPPQEDSPFPTDDAPAAPQVQEPTAEEVLATQDGNDVVADDLPF